MAVRAEDHDSRYRGIAPHLALGAWGDGWRTPLPPGWLPCAGAQLAVFLG